MRRLRHLLEAAAFRVLRALPRFALLALGSLAGTLAYLLDARHRRITLDNLALAFAAERSPAERRRIARRCFRHFGRTLLDSLYLQRLDGPALDRLVHFHGLEHIRGAYAKRRGVLLFSGHFGHWELTAMMQGFLGLPLALVARPLDNPRLERLLAELRRRSGNRVLHKRNAVRGALAALREGGGAAIVIDQDARSAGVFVPFFGHPASTTPTLALLALRSGAAVVPTFSVPQPDGSYLVVYEPEVEVIATGDRAADVTRLTAHCTAILERRVRERPELWLWMHRRWKTAPPGPPALP